jgi:SAM-dependent methyltransferase
MSCITPTHLYRKYLVWKVIKEKVLIDSYFLEIGCGTGDFSLELANLGFSGITIDFSDKAIEEAEKKLKNKEVKAIRSDLFKLKGQFDTIFIFEVLEHVKNDKKAFNKIFNLLKPGGRFLFSVPAHQQMYGRDDKWGGHYRRYERQNLIEMLGDLGLDIKIFWCYGFPVFNFTRWVYNLLCEFRKKKVNKISHIGKAKMTGLDKEGAGFVKKIQWLYPYLLPIFKLCDPFLNSDLGVGYLCYCRKGDHE